MREETNIKKDKNNYTTWKFIFTTFIITYAMGGFIAYGYYTGRDIGFLCTVQMLYPALTALMLDQKGMEVVFTGLNYFMPIWLEVFCL